MDEANKNADQGGGAEKSGCGCSSRANAKAPAKETSNSACCGGHGHTDHSHHDHHAHNAASMRDPVCGMTVDPATSKHRFDHRCVTFHVWSAGCLTKFAADPVSYLEKGS